VAVAEGGDRGEVREYGRIVSTAAALTRLLRNSAAPVCGFGFATRRGRAAMAFNVSRRCKGMSASWSPRH
jgi:hypothetical protein